MHDGSVYSAHSVDDTKLERQFIKCVRENFPREEVPGVVSDILDISHFWLDDLTRPKLSIE